MLLLIACNLSKAAPPLATPEAPDQAAVPHEERWGIYRLGIAAQSIELLYSSPVEIASLRLNSAGDRFVFSQKVDGESNENEEIFSLSIDGSDLRRLTDNSFWDLYPAWSPDGASIAFLSQRSDTLGIFAMHADGGNVIQLADSSSHEADIDWVGDKIVFTKDSRVWIMQSDGSGMRQLNDPPRAGEWGAANLPFGDYDPRLSPDGGRVLFERLVDNQSPHGNYDFFLVDLSSGSETRLSQSGYAQGVASWSHAGDIIVFIVSAIGPSGQYDLYLMNADGSESRSITPSYFPPEFLCHWAVFSTGDMAVYFIGEWWNTE